MITQIKNDKIHQYECSTKQENINIKVLVF
jgi:hypothetical protein